MRLAAQAKGGYYPTPDRVVDMIGGLMRQPYGYHQASKASIRALDPCCGPGDAIGRLTDLLRQGGTAAVETYGVELHKERAEEASTRLDHILPADAFQTSIANGAFGLLFPEPALRLGAGRQEARRTRLPHPLHALPCRRRGARFHRAASTAGGLGTVPVDPLHAGALLGVSRPGAGGLRPGGAHGHPAIRSQPRRLHRGADQGVGRGGNPETLTHSQYTVFYPPVTAVGDILFTRRTVDPVAAAVEARRAGLWTNPQITDVLWPRERGPHPSAHAAAARSHGHAGGGWLPGQPPAGGRRQAHPR